MDSTKSLIDFFSLKLLIYFSISLYSFIILFIETNSIWIIFESIQAIEIKTSMIFNLDFGKDTILRCLLFFFFIIDLYSLIPAVIT